MSAWLPGAATNLSSGDHDRTGYGCAPIDTGVGQERATEWPKLASVSDTESSLPKPFGAEMSNRRAESASSEKLPRGRDLPLQPSSAMGLQLADLHAFDVTAVR